MARSALELERFYEFASREISSHGTSVSLEEIFLRWRTESFPNDVDSEDLAAIQASIEDLSRGETGRPASDVVDDISKWYNLQEVE